MILLASSQHGITYLAMATPNTQPPTMDQNPIQPASTCERAEKGLISWDYSLLVMLDGIQGAARQRVKPGASAVWATMSIRRQNKLPDITLSTNVSLKRPRALGFNGRLHKTDGPVWDAADVNHGIRENMWI